MEMNKKIYWSYDMNSDLLILILICVVWIVLNRWVFPRMGIPT